MENAHCCQRKITKFMPAHFKPHCNDTLYFFWRAIAGYGILHNCSKCYSFSITVAAYGGVRQRAMVWLQPLFSTRQFGYSHLLARYGLATAHATVWLQPPFSTLWFGYSHIFGRYGLATAAFCVRQHAIFWLQPLFACGSTRQYGYSHFLARDGLATATF